MTSTRKLIFKNKTESAARYSQSNSSIWAALLLKGASADMNKKAAPSVGIYCRLSDEDRNKAFKDDDSQSIQNQKSMLLDYAQQKKWNVYKVYSDDDYSGSDRSRPQWNMLLKDCEEGKVNLVLCKSLSRFSRELEIIEAYIHGKFEEWGVRFVSIIDNADTDIESNRKQRQLNSLTNEWYLEDVSNNVKRVLRHMAMKGEFTGSFAPFGYKKDTKDKHHLIVDEPAAEIVRLIFDMYSQGTGTVSICRRLNAQGVPTPSAYKKQQGLNYYCGKSSTSQSRNIWNPSSVTAILDNEVYIGNMVLCKQKTVSYKVHKKISLPKEDWVIVKNTHEPIVDAEIWNLVQELRNSKRRKTKNTQEISSPLIFKLFCGECGASMSQKNISSHNGRYKQRFVFCPVHRFSDNCNNYSNTSLQKLERIVIEEINKLLSRYYDENRIIIQQIRKPKKEELNKKIASLEAELEKNRERQFSLYNDKADGLITPEEFNDFNTRLSDLSKKTNEALKENKWLLRKELEKEKNISSADSLSAEYRQIEKLTTHIVQEFIERIYIYKKEGQTEINIHWNI